MRCIGASYCYPSFCVFPVNSYLFLVEHIARAVSGVMWRLIGVVKLTFNLSKGEPLLHTAPTGQSSKWRLEMGQLSVSNACSNFLSPSYSEEPNLSRSTWSTTTEKFRLSLKVSSSKALHDSEKLELSFSLVKDTKYLLQIKNSH